MYRICNLNNAEILFGPCPSGDALSESIQNYSKEGINIVISLLEEHEEEFLGLIHERHLCEQEEIIFFHFPIVDRSIPSFQRLVHDIDILYNYTFSNNRIFIHCRHGIGRSALITASLMIKHGMTPIEALDIISLKRGLRVPETFSQIKLLSAYYEFISQKQRENEL
jgi:protein-tyrosine phosphatase